MTKLIAIVEGVALGVIESNPRGGALSFAYDPAWLDRHDAFPLSTSMPLGPAIYRQKQIATYLWNLLPENPQVLEAWATEHKISPANPFALISSVGEDAPGAAQFIPEDRAQDYLGDPKGAIEWISVDEVSKRIAILKRDQSAIRLNQDIGRMSLAGAQAKTAYYWDGDRWGVPSGRAPTTHILKPQIPNFEGIVENEHLCLNIAARAGLRAAASRVLELTEPVIVVTRYDRLASKDGSFPRRVHQEDFCQALTYMPARKYQESREPGPGIKDCVKLLRAVSQDPEEDVNVFIKTNMLNWYVGGVDAHAKNFSILIAADGNRLSPLYDVSSQLLYGEQLKQNRNKLAMKIGDHYEIERVTFKDWESMAKACDLNVDQVREWLLELGAALPQHVSDASSEAIAQGLVAKLIEPLRDALIEHIQQRLKSVSA